MVCNCTGRILKPEVLKGVIMDDLFKLLEATEFSLFKTNDILDSYKKEKEVEGPTPKPFFENQLLGYKEAAQYLGISETYLRRLKAAGKIAYVAIGVRGIRFRVSALNKWSAEREVL